MPTIHLYQQDSYLKEADAKVIAVDGNNVILDKTIIHPSSGGVAHDTGLIIAGGEQYRIVDAIHKRDTDDVIHVLDRNPQFKHGDDVKVVLDWDRRYRLMKLHTASHIMAGIAYSKYNALVTGGDIQPDYARDDYSLTVGGEELRRIFNEIVTEANEVIKRGVEVKVYWMPREEALKVPGIVKLAEREPPPGDKWRIVEIPGVDIQADGGPHVANTREIGEIIIQKIENRGRNKKRVYFTVKP
ncbi:alanyl-tRNA editing protein AlaXM [Caldivirga sp.]|uniref:alanyl-tRNA editing protein AlaXM n=1 Tax=Caldivirga sp. TaxID=2080243 RepID=UPI003D0DE2F7